VDDHLPVELIWGNARPPRGLRTYDITLSPDELDVVAGLPVTSPRRTAFDIGCRKPMGLAIAHLDAPRLDRWQYTKDIRRSEELAQLGWIVIRVVASDRPDDIVRRVRDALAYRAAKLH
jgi:hypothetical protein